MKLKMKHKKNNDYYIHLLSFRKCDVLNRGFSGYTTRSDKLILPRLLQKDNNPKGCILAAVILLGSNDCEDISVENSRNVPVDEYKENLKNICRQFKDVGVSFDHQVLIAPPPVNEEKWENFCKSQGIKISNIYILYIHIIYIITSIPEQ